jgi:hypothetical protein
MTDEPEAAGDAATVREVLRFLGLDETIPIRCTII